MKQVLGAIIAPLLKYVSKLIVDWIKSIIEENEIRKEDKKKVEEFNNAQKLEDRANAASAIIGKQ